MKKSILSILLLFSFLIVEAQNPLVIAHRGASAYRPENTLSAFKHAFELGADAVEVDIWMTKDRKIVVTHDKETKRVADRNLVVPESTYAQLQELKLQGGERIPLFEEVLAMLPEGKKIFIEIKCCWEKGQAGNVFPEVKKLIKKYKREKDCVFIAFNPAVLADAGKQYPQIPTFVLSGKQDSNQALIDLVKKNKLTGLDAHHGVINEEVSALLVENNVPLYVWTVNKDEDMKRMIANPLVKGITTDKPDALIRCIKANQKN